MSKKGCGFNGGSCRVTVEKCAGCAKVIEVASATYCSVYPDPASKWRMGTCPLATHVKRELKDTSQKLNPLKASKRAKK